MLQSLLQPGAQRNSKMIGAMPAVAVRHERRRQEKRGRRPSQLTLQIGRSANSTSSTPSPPGGGDHHNSHYYICVKMSALHVVVGSILLGIVVMVVGLVQLSPGAEAAQHRFYLIGGGVALILFGVSGAIVRCVCVHLHNRSLYEQQAEAQATHSSAKSNPGATKNGVQAVNERGKTAHKTVTSPLTSDVKT